MMTQQCSSWKQGRERYFSVKAGVTFFVYFLCLACLVATGVPNPEESVLLFTLTLCSYLLAFATSGDIRFAGRRLPCRTVILC